MKKYNVGDHVWLVHCGTCRVEEICPVCFGEKRVTLILGNRDLITLPCDYCSKGFDFPRGYIVEYRYVSTTEHVMITDVHVAQSINKETIEYISDHGYLREEDIFDTEAEALVRCETKTLEMEHERITKSEYIKANTQKSFSWNAGYHLRAAKKSQESVDYHNKMAVICKAKSREMVEV